MFLTLGLLVSPKQLLPTIVPGIVISVVMILIARPASVFVCLAPFKRSFKEKLFISWVGLKGAAPIIFAIMLLTADTPNAEKEFNIVFMCTLISLLVQGTSLTLMAKKLNLIDETDDLSQPKNFDLEFSDDIKSVTTEIKITQDDLDERGRFIKDLPLPENTLVVMVKRGGRYFVPKGRTELLTAITFLSSPTTRIS
jgi:cell volume regulation protein A